MCCLLQNVTSERYRLVVNYLEMLQTDIYDVPTIYSIVYLYYKSLCNAHCLFVRDKIRLGNS